MIRIGLRKHTDMGKNCLRNQMGLWLVAFQWFFLETLKPFGCLVRLEKPSKLSHDGKTKRFRP